jgi:hypothetical protein
MENTRRSKCHFVVRSPLIYRAPNPSVDQEGTTYQRVQVERDIVAFIQQRSSA